MLPPQVVSRQSPEVDYVSGATQSTNAFYYAVVEALVQGEMIRTVAVMGTIVTIQVVGHGADGQSVERGGRRRARVRMVSRGRSVLHADSIRRAS